MIVYYQELWCNLDINLWHCHVSDWKCSFSWTFKGASVWCHEGTSNEDVSFKHAQKYPRLWTAFNDMILCIVAWLTELWFCCCFDRGGDEALEEQLRNLKDQLRRKEEQLEQQSREMSSLRVKVNTLTFISPILTEAILKNLANYKGRCGKNLCIQILYPWILVVLMSCLVGKLKEAKSCI